MYADCYPFWKLRGKFISLSLATSRVCPHSLAHGPLPPPLRWGYRKSPLGLLSWGIHPWDLGIRKLSWCLPLLPMKLMAGNWNPFTEKTNMSITVLSNSNSLAKALCPHFKSHVSASNLFHIQNLCWERNLGK